ncbi:MAG TPA: efflux transporter outer membrane subunit [Verrucomicrobiae bacterium]|nr:efflux transporter outer membrane subunit [Verrucomicrobiae bacterium]
MTSAHSIIGARDWPLARSALSRSFRHISTVAALIFILAGCTVGPNYSVPKPALPAKFSESTVPVTASNSVPALSESWWVVFNDATLNELMQEAIRSAPDLAIANARVLEARALRRFVGADQYPTVDSEASYARSRGSVGLPIGIPPGGLGSGVDSSLWQAGFDASWEVDVFGGVRRRVESANAAYQVAVESRRDVALTLFAEISRDYMDLRSTQRQLAVSRDNLAIARDLLSLVRSRFNAGLASSQDVSKAQADVAAAEAQIPVLVRDEHASIYLIGVLVGRNPEELLAELSEPKSLQSMVPPDVPVGLPSDLLRRRPDIRVAERRVASENAKIGVAKADLYPHFYLTGVTGLESLSFSSFFNIASGYYSVGPGITWKVFDASKVRSEVLMERARTDQAAAAFQTTVLSALKEVETALVSYAQAQARHDSLAGEAEADQKTLELSRQLYNRGVQDFFVVLEAERSLNSAQYELATSDRDTAVALISLYKSLGGGWTSKEQ